MGKIFMLRKWFRKTAIEATTEDLFSRHGVEERAFFKNKNYLIVWRIHCQSLNSLVHKTGGAGQERCSGLLRMFLDGHRKRV